MKKRSSSQKRNSKSLLSTTIEQIKKDLKEDYEETLGNFHFKQKKKNKKKFDYPVQESEKTNDENMNYNDIDLSKLKNKKSLNINTNYNENNLLQNKYMNHYHLSSENYNNYITGEKESRLQK